MSRKFDDRALVSRINAGDHAAFSELFQHYKSILYVHAYRMIADQEVCNDIIQEVFLKIWQNHQSFHITTSLIAYLFQAVKNKTLDYISHQKVINKYEIEIQSFIDTGICYTEDYLLEKELLASLEFNKAQLPPRTREIFELNKEQHLSYKEIGEKLSISEKTAKKQVHNALRFLRSKFYSLFLSLLLFFLFF